MSNLGFRAWVRGQSFVFRVQESRASDFKNGASQFVVWRPPHHDPNEPAKLEPA